MSLKIIALTVVVTAFGLYEIAHGYRQSRRYNLRFLLVGGLLTGLPFLAAGAILVFSQSGPVGSWKYLVLAAWVLGVLWETWQRRKYYRTNQHGQNQVE